MRTHRRLAVTVSVLVSGLAACAPPLEPLPFEPAGPESAPAPSAYGPFPVGVRTVSFVDDLRPAPPPFEGQRTLVTEIWYPATERARLPPGAVGEKYVLYDGLPEEQREGLTPEDLGTLETIAVRDAEPRTDRGPFPIVLFSHGHGGLRFQSTFYTVMLASHGYVVVSPDHQGDTIVEILEAGEIEIDATFDSFIDRPEDLVFLLEAIESDPLASIVDMEHVGTTGHSLGAFTAMAVAGQHAGVKATVGQNPMGVTAVEAVTTVPLAEFGIPVMIQSSAVDGVLPADVHAQSLWDHMLSPRAWMSLVRGGHFTYSDLCIFDVAAIDAALDLDASRVLGDGCGPDNTPPTSAFPLINNAAIGFFNVHLRESPGSAAFLTQETNDALAQGEATLLQ